MFKTTGKLHYDSVGKVVLSCDTEIANYYRSLIPKHIRHMGQRYPAHITVVRSGRETVKNPKAWGRHEGEMIEFEYDPYVKIGKVYIWLDAYSDRLKEIREELGLESNRIHYPTQSLYLSFHITIANKKEYTSFD